jgi:biopolymer transport protein ExbB/TolQ
MAGEEILNAPADLATEIITQLGSIGKWLQAIGLIVILWIIFQIINWVTNRKRIKRLDKLSDRLDTIEKKIDKVLKKR